MPRRTISWSSSRKTRIGCGGGLVRGRGLGSVGHAHTVVLGRAADRAHRPGSAGPWSLLRSRRRGEA